jgi:hypothetical protein
MSAHHGADESKVKNQVHLSGEGPQSVIVHGVILWLEHERE